MEIVIIVILFCLVIMVPSWAASHYLGAILDKRRRCAWCDKNRTKLRYYGGDVGDWCWEYSNQDGGPDKRRKDNIQIASYKSQYTCKKCNARTWFTHAPKENPSRKDQVIARGLERDGEGERIGTDWQS